MRFPVCFSLVICLLFIAGCTRRKEIWVYTSLSKEVIAEMVEPLQVAVPEADIKWYQSGSDNVATRMNSEMEAGKVKADLVLTCDPFWYQEMKQKSRLLAYDSPAAKEVPALLRDPENAFVAVRVPILVLGYNATYFKPTELPENWKDLSQSRFHRKLSMGSPLDSASSYVALAMLSKLYGWEYFAELRKQGLVAEGAYSSVLTRIETGERPLGILPLENVLRAGLHNKDIKPIYPLDGVIPVPCPIGILKETDHPEIAKSVFDWFFGPVAQSAIVRGGAYSPLPKMATPDGARPWAELKSQMMKWSPETLTEMLSQRDRVRAKFSEVVLH